MGARREGGSGFEQFTVRPLLGGLDTKTPPQLLGAGRGAGSSVSPDLVNVAFDRRGASTRGGFVPYTKQGMRLSCMRGVAFRRTGRQQFINNSPDVDYIVAPGALYAGHRPIYDDLAIRKEITIECWFSPSDLVTVHGGNASTAGPPTGGTAPYDLLVRPILSKGPVKKNAMSASTLGAPQASGQIAWVTGSRWGNTTTDQHAMPFCLYLYQVSPGTWEFRFSAHFRAAPLWHLATVTNACATLGGVREGVAFHVIARYSVVDHEMTLTVGIFDVDAMRYETAQIALDPTFNEIAAGTPCPVQAFDCPQEFCDAPAAPHVTRPPGLELADEYWFNSVRATGRLEDVAIYRGNLTTLQITGAPRRRDTTGLPVVSHWPGDSSGDAGVFDEVSGLGNDLVATPGFPLRSKGGWRFNGITSYGLMEMSNENYLAGASGGNPNWRWAPPSTAVPLQSGAFQDCVRYGFPHGLEVAFWVDTLEPNFEQVLMEAHGVIRLAIGVDGKIRGYVRDTAAAPNPPLYQNAVVGVTTLVPGNRYVALLFRESATSLAVYVNGSREGQIAVAASSTTGWPVGGLTVGMGSYKNLTRTDLASGDPDNHTLIADIVSTDHRSGFMGRIEYARVLVGSPFHATTVSWYDKEYEKKLRDASERGNLWLIPGGAPNRWDLAFGAAAAIVATTANIGPGHASAQQIDKPFGKQLAYVVSSSTSSPTYYLVHLTVRSIADGGHIQVDMTSVEFVRTLGSWDFSTDKEDFPYSASHDMAFEYLDNGGAFYVPNSWRTTAGLRTDVVDAAGFLGPAQKRSVEPDLLGHAYTEMAALNWNRLGKPFMLNGPRECRPQIGYGMLVPLLGEAPIAGIAHFENQVSGEHALIIAGRRNLCWTPTRWELGSPFEDRDDWALCFRNANDRVRRERLATYNAGVTWATGFAEVDLWIRPERLDGKRILVCSGDVDVSTGAASMRYLIYLDDGVLYVLGAETGNNAWVYMQGAFGASPTLRPRCSLVLGEWNHIVVRIANSTVIARINGHLESMASLFGFLGSAINTGTIKAPSPARLWIGGIDATRQPLRIPTLGGAATITLALSAFVGSICWVRERSTPDAQWTDGQNGLRPTAPPTPDANTRWLYALADRDEGWTAIDSSPSAVHGRIELDECVPLKTDLLDVGINPVPYSTALVRDQLIFTNGVDYPHAVTSTSRTDKESPFRVARLGMAQPGLTSTGLSMLGSTLGTFEANRTFSVWMTYVNALNQESEPTYLGAVSSGAGVKDELHVTHIPRSPDPQVVARRFYIQTDDSAALFAQELSDNVSRDMAIRSVNNLPGLVAARRLPGPKAKLVEVGPGTVYLANLEGNGHAFAFSGDGQTSYFPLVNFIAEDSKGGAPIIGMRRQIGAIYLLKRDGSSRVVNRGGVVQVDDVDDSQAPAGASVNVDNAIMGICPRGVVTLDGANTAYVSDKLEALIRGDVFRQQLGREDELLRAQGVYSLVDSTILFSVRGADATKRTIFALHIDRVAGQAPWSIWRVPPHVAASRVVDPGGRTIEVLIGTVDGMVLAYNRDAHADGAWVGTNEFGVSTLSAPITGPFSASTYTHASANVFDTHGDGLRGAIVLVVDANGDVVAETRVARNTHQVLTFKDTITLGSGAYTLWIGGIESRWSSPWLEWQRPGSGIMVDGIDLDIEAQPTSMRLEMVTSERSVPGRLFPSGSVPAEREIRTVALANGVLKQPIPIQLQNRGRNVRFRVGTVGTQIPWSLFGYSLRFTETGHRGDPT